MRVSRALLPSCTSLSVCPGYAEACWVGKAVSMLYFLKLLFSQVEAACDETRLLAIANQKLAAFDSLYGWATWSLSNQLYWCHYVFENTFWLWPRSWESWCNEAHSLLIFPRKRPAAGIPSHMRAWGGSRSSDMGSWRTYRLLSIRGNPK